MPAVPRINLVEVREFFASNCKNNRLLSRLGEYAKSGVFIDNMGRKDDVGNAHVSYDQAALLYYLVRKLNANLTVETGFGGGISAGIILAAKVEFSVNWKRHFSIDPYGLSDGRGTKAQSFIEETFGNEFVRVKESSEFALPLIARSHQGQIKVALIDGGHWFETALVDFVFFDRMCPVGGCIVMDDVGAPALESVVNYITANREDYFVETTIDNTAILWKICGLDARNWDHFRPFKVPDRQDWKWP